jgi:hypothetical protein
LILNFIADLATGMGHSISIRGDFDAKAGERADRSRPGNASQ